MMAAKNGKVRLGLLATALLLPCLLAAAVPAQTPAAAPATTAPERDGGHDFDFVIGRLEGPRAPAARPAQELWKGRAVLVRYEWTDISPKSALMQQAFSADGGKSWEVNWICELSR
jgi:hypothetical protein